MIKTLVTGAVAPSAAVASTASTMTPDAARLLLERLSGVRLLGFAGPFMKIDLSGGASLFAPQHDYPFEYVLPEELTDTLFNFDRRGERLKRFYEAAQDVPEVLAEHKQRITEILEYGWYNEGICDEIELLGDPELCARIPGIKAEMRQRKEKEQQKLQEFAEKRQYADQLKIAANIVRYQPQTSIEMTILSGFSGVLVS